MLNLLIGLAVCVCRQEVCAMLAGHLGRERNPMKKQNWDVCFGKVHRFVQPALNFQLQAKRIQCCSSPCWVFLSKRRTWLLRTDPN